MMNSQRITVERIQDVNELDSLREEWNTLSDISQTKTPELMYEWQMTYWKYFNAHAELFVLVVRKNGLLVAISPLKLVSAYFMGIKIRRLVLIAMNESNYQDFVLGENSEEVLEGILKYLLDVQGSWDVLEIHHIPEDSDTIKYLLKKFENLPFYRKYTEEKCIYLEVDNETSAEYLECLKSKGSVKNLARLRKKMEREVGEVCLVHCSSEDELQKGLLKLFELHRARWNQTDSPSQFNDDRYCKFYLDAVMQLFLKGRIGMDILNAGGEPMAITLQFIFNKTIIGQLMAYAPGYVLYSPMNLLLEMFVEESVSSGIEIVDFGSYYSYKEKWTNKSKNRVDFEVYRKELLPASIYFFEAFFDSLRSRLRRIPRLMGFAKYVRGRLRLLLGNVRWSFDNVTCLKKNV